METMMKLRLFIVLAVTLLGLSACVVEPYGYGPGYGYGYGYSGGGGSYYYGGGHSDYGHRVWRE
jgi:hypothetical protein